MKKIITLLLLSGTLTACSNIPDHRDTHIDWRSDIKREHKIIDLHFATGSSSLTKQHKSTIQKELGQFDSLDSVYARVFVDASESQTLSGMQTARLKKVKTFMTRKGIKGQHIKFYRWKESRFGDLKENTLMIIFDHNKVAPNKCPGWNSAINDKESPDGTSDLGCANAHNQAVLVEDKNDLIEGKTLKDRDSSLKLKAVKNYQLDKTKELKTIKSSTTDSGSSN